MSGFTTDLPRTLLNELDSDEWMPRYAAILLDSVDERDKRIAKLEDWVRRIANAPETQVSAFIRTASIAFLDNGSGDLPPADPLKHITYLEVKNKRLRKGLRGSRVVAVDVTTLRGPSVTASLQDETGKWRRIDEHNARIDALLDEERD